jgi:anti-sigma factor RsiW
VTDRIVCASGVELLMDFLEDALPADLRADLEAHVASCAPCTAFVASYRATPRIFRAATLARLPEDLEESLLDFLRRRR